MGVYLLSFGRVLLGCCYYFRFDVVWFVGVGVKFVSLYLLVVFV